MTVRKPRAAKPKNAPLTDAERHQRFKDMALEVEASEAVEEFDSAFAKVVTAPSPEKPE